MALKCFFLSLVSLLFSSLALSQNPWQLKKDQDGIKIWKGDTEHFNFKTYKSETIVYAELEKVKQVLMDMQNLYPFKEGFYNVTDVNWLSDAEVAFRSNSIFQKGQPFKQIQLKRRAIPIEVGSYEINTMVVADSTQVEEPLHTNKYFSIWILVNAGKGKTYIKHIISNNPSEREPDWLIRIKAINQRFTAMENLKKRVE